MESAPHREGLILRAFIEPRVRATDIARAGDPPLSRAYVSQVLSGREKASPRFIDACRKLGLPVDLLFGQAADPPETRTPAFGGHEGVRDTNRGERYRIPAR